MTRPTRFGGSFAPPLSLAQLKQYEKLAEGAAPRIRETMLNMITMVREYLKQPKSRNGGTPHPSGVGVMVPLEARAIKKLDRFVPYIEECKMHGELFATIQSNESDENARRMAKWREQVFEKILIQETGKTPVQVRAFKEDRRAKRLVSRRYKSQTVETKALDVKLAKVREVYVRVLAGDAKAPVPLPEREDTALRDAAHHLLWYATELALDREPMTKDLLPKNMEITQPEEVPTPNGFEGKRVTEEKKSRKK